jgi:hypothetical protein
VTTLADHDRLVFGVRRSRVGDGNGAGGADQALRRMVCVVMAAVPS